MAGINPMRFVWEAHTARDALHCAPRASLQLVWHFTDGHRTTVVTDEDWKTVDGLNFAEPAFLFG